MFQKRKEKKSLNLQKGNKKEKSSLKVEIKTDNGTIVGKTTDSRTDEDKKMGMSQVNTVEEVFDSLKSSIRDSQFNTIESTTEEKKDLQEEMTSLQTPDKPTKKRRKYTVPFARFLTGNEVEDFIKNHSDFTVVNSIDSFELFELVEGGLNIPEYHFNYKFPEYEKLETGLDLETIPKGLCESDIRRSMYEMVPVDEDTVFQLHRLKNVRVFGKLNVSFELKFKVDRLKNVNGIICMFSKDKLVTYDLKRLQSWSIPVTDATGNNLGEFIVLEDKKFINVYRGGEMILRVELNTIAERIASFYDRKVVVHTVFKILFILDLDTRHIEIISGPPNEKLESLEVVNNFVLLRTIYRLYFIDLANKNKFRAFFNRDFRYSLSNGLVRTSNFRDYFRYFELENPRNNFSVTYKDKIKGFASYKDTVWLEIGEVVRMYRGGEVVEEFPVEKVRSEYDFTNIFFTEDGFEIYKEAYRKIKKETLDFLPNDLNLDLKADVDKILGREKVKGVMFESQKSVNSSQKKKKGGF